jgi:hypothetical protein
MEEDAVGMLVHVVRAAWVLGYGGGWEQASVCGARHLLRTTAELETAVGRGRCLAALALSRRSDKIVLSWLWD